MNGVIIDQFRVLFVLLGIMFFIMFNCVFLSALLYVLLPSGVINHICMYMYVWYGILEFNVPLDTV